MCHNTYVEVRGSLMKSFFYYVGSGSQVQIVKLVPFSIGSPP